MEAMLYTRGLSNTTRDRIKLIALFITNMNMSAAVKFVGPMKGRINQIKG